MPANSPIHYRKIRSYVRREGRMTGSQQRALDTLWVQFGVQTEAGGLLDLAAIFGRSAPRVLEIGFGNGESLASMAQAQPEVDFLGIEVHRPGVGHLLLQADALEIGNLKVICADAVESLSCLPDESFARIQVFFPDPWPKKRHHKRRLIQSSFITLLARKLEAGGYLHLATDWEHYAQHMLAMLKSCELLHNTVAGGFVPRPPQRPLTKFERRGQRLGHQVWDLMFQRR